ncbi:hypothetical protein Forpe1208_v011129 [Fusarium oxysporum f. sp. rapae]|uniref:Heterokaryon incompatibility domain-containing protein n=1 Tax=Fusarium oxysporum f. sp. rapae TaxID=485398 RepID=A0A8J5NXT2_FUSOX|nr:hypothetical protein Forpe1208_v011129 [Fusarium oxysporum f. sp. rapae]
MTELQDKNSNSSLCNICCGADFPGMFTGRDSHDGFNCYRADLSFEKQVREPGHTFNECKVMCLLRVDLPSDTVVSADNTQLKLFTAPEPLPDAREDDMVIAVVEILTGMFHGVFTQCIGFHNDTYCDPSHESLMVRGLQLCAPERSRGPQWKRAYEEMEQAKDALGWGPDKELNMPFTKCFGGRLVSRDIDFGHCKGWLGLCGDQHKECREHKPLGMIARPNRLIDVHNNCIVSGLSSLDGYAALSYVWGGGILGTQLKTTNELMLRQPESLSAPSIVLCGTITDAMEFCRRIGLRLLWVDQLCIPQRQDSIDPEIH